MIVGAASGFKGGGAAVDPQGGIASTSGRPQRRRMGLDVLILNSGEWVLGEELSAAPWYVLVYRQRGEPRNELHLWLPREDAVRSGDFAFKRYWVDDAVRWCVERPGAAGEPGRPAGGRLRFTSPDGQVLWADPPGARGLGDLSDHDLGRLLAAAREGPFSGY
jgi:hypothetical protein